jgi:polyisoprenoid-binding protein YceI
MTTEYGLPIPHKEFTMTTEAPSTTRLVDGRLVPAAGRWELDPSHSRVEFVARHLMVTKVRGAFKEFSGSFEVAEDPAASTLTVDVDLVSVDTGAEDRDNHLRSPDFFDLDNHPNMTFRSTGLSPNGDNWKLTGDLSIKGVTRPVMLDMEFLGVAADPWGNAKAAFSATGEIEREDFGVTWNVPLEGGGVLVSKKIRIEIEAQAVMVTDEG